MSPNRSSIPLCGHKFMIFFTYYFRYFSRTRTQFFEKKSYPLRLRTTIWRKNLSTFRTRHQTLKTHPYPLLTRTPNSKIYPCTFRFRFRIWLRVRDGYGFRTRTSGYELYHHFGRFSKKRDLQSNWFSSKIDLCSFFLAQEFTNIKNCLGTIKDLTIGYQSPKRQNLVSNPIWV